MSMQLKRKIIYLDNATTTPLDPDVLNAMRPFLTVEYGNPSALYQQGREAKKAIDASRKIISDLINAKPEEIIFTAGGTESDNLAIFGPTRNYAELNAELRRKKLLHIITTKIEHSAVLDSCRQLEKENFAVTYLKVDKQGFVDLKQLQKSLRPETVLISIMYANNEIGTIQPIVEIGKWLARINTARLRDGLTRIVLHTDACQAGGHLDLNVNKLGVDLMTVNASKMYGPKQVGFLFVRNGTLLKPLIYGGGQEKNLRSGTENVAGIIGLAKALELAQKNREKENTRLLNLRNYFAAKIKKILPNAILNGPINEHLNSLKRLPNSLNFTIPGIEGEALLLYLDAHGICAGTGSACDTNSDDASHVLLALGRSVAEAKSSIRFSLGKFTTKKDLDFVIKILPRIIDKLRAS